MNKVVAQHRVRVKGHRAQVTPWTRAPSVGVSAFALLLVCLPARAAPDALQLMRAQEQQHRVGSEEVKMRMTLQKKGETPRARELERVVVQDLKGVAGDKVLMRFVAPPTLLDLKFLQLEGTGSAPSDQWLYLPAFHKARRVGAAELGDRFAESDLFYEDLRHLAVDDYAYKYVEEVPCGDKRCHKIEARAASERAKAESPYGMKTYFLRTDINFATRVDFYSRDMKLQKTYEVKKLVKVSGGAWRADLAVMTDLQREHRTTIEVISRVVDQPVSDGLFNPAALGN